MLGFFLGIIGILILICLPESKINNDAPSSPTNTPIQPQQIPVLPQDIQTTSQSFVFEDSLKDCPYCFEPVQKQARYCQYCKHDISYAPDDTPVFPAPEDLIIDVKTAS